MPSRKEAFALARQLFGLCGVETFVRGMFYPEETGDAYPASSYPVAAFVEKGEEETNPQEYSYKLRFEFEVDIFLWTDWTATPGTPEPPPTDSPDDFVDNMGWAAMDDFHDNALQQFARYFAGDDGPVSQTTVFRIIKYKPLWFYRLKQGVIAATFTLECQMNFA